MKYWFEKNEECKILYMHLEEVPLNGSIRSLEKLLACDIFGDIGIIGFIGCGVNYPLYKKKLEKDKAKYAYEIVELAKEIANED